VKTWLDNHFDNHFNDPIRFISYYTLSCCGFIAFGTHISWNVNAFYPFKTIFWLFYDRFL